MQLFYADVACSVLYFSQMTFHACYYVCILQALCAYDISQINDDIICIRSMILVDDFTVYISQTIS